MQVPLTTGCLLIECGVGIHDSDWQTSYGGDLWKTRGSHGCVNTPPSVMKELYGLVSEGTPVIVF